MKRKEKTGCYNMLVQSGKFSNDGHGTLYIQEPPGVQYAISTKEAAHIVAKWLKDKAGFLLPKIPRFFNLRDPQILRP